jgi:RNA polymerase sigma factor (TIGR02999 family)
LRIVYDDLRRLAASWFRSAGAPQTLQPTALVNEALARLMAAEATTWQDRAHFMAVAATAMRQVLIDHARRRRAQKRGGLNWRQITLHPAIRATGADCVDVLALDETLTRLAKLSARQARVVELRVFGGLTIEEASEVLGVGVHTIKSDWLVAKTWLKRELGAKE